MSTGFYSLSHAVMRSCDTCGSRMAVDGHIGVALRTLFLPFIVLSRFTPRKEERFGLVFAYLIIHTERHVYVGRRSY